MPKDNGSTTLVLVFLAPSLPSCVQQRRAKPGGTRIEFWVSFLLSLPNYCCDYAKGRPHSSMFLTSFAFDCAAGDNLLGQGSGRPSH